MKPLKKVVTLPPFVKEGYVGFSHSDGSVYAAQEFHAPFINHLCSKINVVVPGTGVYETRGKDNVPLQPIATSCLLKPDKTVYINLDYNEAIRYLRGEALALPDGTPRGFLLAAYQNMPLGWMKNIGKRANNLYPKEWRIKSTYAPNEYEPIIYLKNDRQ